MIYRFENFELNIELYTLSRGGQTKRLRRKVFEVLRYLLEHRERVVSKPELAEQVWPDQFIANSTLEGTIRLLRQDLGDSGRAQRIIQTSHGYGYRFAVPVITPEESQLPGNPPHDEEFRCPACQHVNPTGLTGGAFCINCGTELRASCSRCGTENLPEANFCASCGAALDEEPATFTPTHQDPQSPTSQSQPLPSPPVPTGGDRRQAERRQLTVMVCDLVDAATLPERLDLEDLHDVIGIYQRTCNDAVRNFEGHIATTTGSEVVVYFGYPQAHEDDARRAVHAGLGIVEALRAMNARLTKEKSIKLTVRIGIHTGLVVIGGLSGDNRYDALALGETPNIASQIRGIGAPDKVTISADTANLVQGYTALKDLDTHVLEGTVTPVQLFQVIGLSGAHSRLDTVSPGGLTPFVGREAELSLLLERWTQVKEGRGQAVLLSGEAGVGKSRLVQVLKERIAEDNYLQLECRCSPYYQHSALYPVIELLNRVLQWQHDDSPDEKFDRLETVLTQYGLPLNETIPLFASLLGLPAPDDRYAPLYLAPQQQRQRTLEAILALLVAMATKQPMLLIIEDLHWLDPSTLELLTLLMDQTPTTSICLLLTYRPMFQSSWGNRSYLTQITLPHLPRHQAEQMVVRITGGKVLPPQVLRQVLEQTDGIPLFVEELTKTILETGQLREIDDRYELTEPSSSLAIPTTLHASLMARLDRLETAKGVAQLAATIGRQFSYPLIRAIWGQDEALLQHGLERLIGAELVYQQGLYPQATYVFKHALIQETAYQSLLRRTRQHYHERIARVLIEKFHETVELQPELLAHHYTGANLIEKALPYWQRAGRLAVERSANAEAIGHFTNGLELLKLLPEAPERVQQELDLRLGIGAPLLMMKGHTAPEVEHTYSRAYELALQLGETPQSFSVLIGLWRFYFNQARLLKARTLAEQCFSLARRLREPMSLQEAHQVLGSTLFFMGELVEAHAHLEEGVALYDAEQSHALAFSRGTDPGVVALCRLAWTLWWLGYPDRALARSLEAIALAKRLSHLYSLIFAMQYHAHLHMCRREVSCAKEQFEAVMTLMQENGFVQFWRGGMTRLGLILVEQGATEEGIAQIRQGLNTQQIYGVELTRCSDLVMLVQAYVKAGRAQEGLRVVGEALEIAHNNAVRHYESELYRLKGELLRQSDSHCQESDVSVPHDTFDMSAVEEVEACYQQAITVAYRQGAKSLELRAVMSLSRLWQQQGKHAAARQKLMEIYSWFSEGFDTQDLQEAKALLEELQ